MGVRKPSRLKRKLPKQLQPDGIRLEYFKAIRAEVLEPARQLVRRELLPLLPGLVAEASRKDRMDSKRVNLLMDRLSEQYFARIRPNELARLPERFGQATSRWQKDQLNKQIRAAVGVDVLGDDPKLAKRMAGFVAENVALIRSVPNKYLDDVEKRVLAGLNAGARHEEIAAQLEERFGIAEDSAKLIARDQVGKFYGQLNQARQEELGITGYVWRTSQDNRVREEHELREGEQFEWDDPPEDGHPGEAIQCRCTAEPNLYILLAGLEE